LVIKGGGVRDSSDDQIDLMIFEGADFTRLDIHGHGTSPCSPGVRPFASPIARNLAHNRACRSDRDHDLFDFGSMDEAAN
jgi:hypothetical protein